MKKDAEQETSFVFTLAEDAPVVNNTVTKSSEPEYEVPGWARSLEQLRQHKKSSVDIITSKDNQPARSAPQHTAPFYGQSRRQFNRPADQKAGGYRDLQDIKAQRSAPVQTEAAAQPRFVLDPVQREHAYQTYLKQWQKQVNQEVMQQEATLNDSTVLLQEDWLAAQNCLQTAPADNHIACTIKLQRHKPAQVVTAESAASDNTDSHTLPDQPSASINQSPDADDQPPIHVHLHVIEPRGREGRAVTCLSEQALLQQLADKLRPHLADVLAGMVRVAVQRHTASMIAALQKELLAEIPNAVDDVLRHNLARIMKNIKQNQRGI
ncbi:hypothetical protein PT286_03220 [Neisseriaceae bacterium ESL0693]|nr:hypothetical protein [Neisseriaceae bacterium ESL0693]